MIEHAYLIVYWFGLCLFDIYTYYTRVSIYMLTLKFVHLPLICRCKAQAFNGPTFILKFLLNLMIRYENLVKEISHNFINTLTQV